MTAPTASPQMKDHIMTDIAVPDQHIPAVAAPAASPFTVQSSIAQWATEADLAYQLANRLATTSFVPSTMRGKVGDITACLLAGNELGLPPMASLKSMDVIHGTPGLRAHAMRGLVQSKGHEIELIESTDTVCRMRGRRKGSENWQEIAWTIGRAQLAGFPAKNPNYKTQPANMLVARATGEICRLIASDALHGVPYTTEELRDFEPRVTAVQVGAPVTAAEILGRRGGPAPMPQPAPEVVQAGPDVGPQDIWDRLTAARQIRGWGEEQAEAEFEAWSGGTQMGAAEDEQLAAFIAYIVEGVAS